MKYDQTAYDHLVKELNIERNALDEEAVVQPNNSFHASEGHVYAIARRDAAKHDMDIRLAELDRDVRDSMVAEDGKITEALVKAQISREPDYDRVHRTYLAACLEAGRWEALKYAYRQRGDMIKGLIQLHQSGYFGEVTGAAERRGAIERVGERRRPR